MSRFCLKEYEIDKSLGIKGPEDVARMGIAEYNKQCRNIVMRYSKEWEVRDPRKEALIGLKLRSVCSGAIQAEVVETLMLCLCTLTSTFLPMPS